MARLSETDGFLRSRSFFVTDDAEEAPHPFLAELGQLSQRSWQSLTEFVAAAQAGIDEALANLFQFDGPTLSQDAYQILSVLLLGPSGGGKTTLFRAALTLAGEVEGDADADAPAPTRGLVRRVMPLPLPGTTDAQATSRQVQLCDAGGGREERRQWVVLVREAAPIAALVFVADVGDDAEETLGLFKQLAGAPWARDAALVLALTHADAVGEGNGDSPALDVCAARVAAYRERSARPVSVHTLNARDPAEAAKLLAEVTEFAVRASAESQSSDADATLSAASATRRRSQTL